MSTRLCFLRLIEGERRPGCREWRLIGWRGGTGERREWAREISNIITTTNDNWEEALEKVSGGTPSLCARNWRALVHLSPIMASFDQGFRRQTCLRAFARALFGEPVLLYPRCDCTFVVCNGRGRTERWAALKSESLYSFTLGPPLSWSIIHFSFRIYMYRYTKIYILFFPPYSLNIFFLFFHLLPQCNVIRGFLVDFIVERN